MSFSIKTFCLAAAGATSLGAMVAAWAGPAAACDIASPTDLTCGPANVNPANPLSLNNPANPNSPFNPSNPANPASPLNPANINNPSNPASPLNWSNSLSNPANPLSPLNPMNQQQADEPAPGYYGGGILSSLLGLDAGPSVTPPDGYEPDNYPAVHHRHHHRHRPIE